MYAAAEGSDVCVIDEFDIGSLNASEAYSCASQASASTNGVGLIVGGALGGSGLGGTHVDVFVPDGVASVTIAKAEGDSASVPVSNNVAMYAGTA